MNYSQHCVTRMNQRGITQAMAELVYAYGEVKGDKVILNKKMATERLCEARAERSTVSKGLDTGVSDMSSALHLIASLDAEIRNLTKLVDKHGTTLVVSGDTVITAYGIH